jgi:hypothetical protein
VAQAIGFLPQSRVHRLFQATLSGNLLAACISRIATRISGHIRNSNFLTSDARAAPHAIDHQISGACHRFFTRCVELRKFHSLVVAAKAGTISDIEVVARH